MLLKKNKSIVVNKFKKGEIEQVKTICPHVFDTALEKLGLSLKTEKEEAIKQGIWKKHPNPRRKGQEIALVKDLEGEWVLEEDRNKRNIYVIRKMRRQYSRKDTKTYIKTSTVYIKQKKWI